MNPWQPPAPPGWGPPAPPGPYGPGGQLPYPPPQQPAYPYPAAPPSGVTAILAAVLSFLGATAAVLGLIGSVMALSTSVGQHLGGYFALSGLLSFALAAALITGGTMLLRRRLAGRIVIAAACGLAILIALVSFVYAQHLLHSVSDQYGMHVNDVTLGYGAPRLLLQLVMPAATLALALVPSTRLWCLAGAARPPAAPHSPW